MNIFENDLTSAERKLKKAIFWKRILSIITLGTIDNANSVQKAQQKYDECKHQYEKFVSLTNEAKYLDDQLLKEIEIDGIRISYNTFADFKSIGVKGYPINWEELRGLVLTRDNFQCQELDGYCKGPLQIHHILPLSKGGNNDLNNLITLCFYHHACKHEHMKEKYIGNIRG